jgi:hypothetical protein
MVSWRGAGASILGADPAFAHDLGGKGWSWMTGWSNIVGLVGIVASVGYGAATFLNATLGLYGLDILGVNFGDDQHILSETWLLFFLILCLYTVVNIFADRFLALMNDISVGWHVLGVAYQGPVRTLEEDEITAGV